MSLDTALAGEAAKCSPEGMRGLDGLLRQLGAAGIRVSATVLHLMKRVSIVLAVLGMMAAITSAWWFGWPAMVAALGCYICGCIGFYVGEALLLMLNEIASGVKLIVTKRNWDGIKQGSLKLGWAIRCFAIGAVAGVFRGLRDSARGVGKGVRWLWK